MTHRSPIKPLPPLEASPEVLDEARATCAERARARGDGNLADEFAVGSQDLGWAVRHEVLKLLREN